MRRTTSFRRGSAQYADRKRGEYRPFGHVRNAHSAYAVAYFLRRFGYYHDPRETARTAGDCYFFDFRTQVRRYARIYSQRSQKRKTGIFRLRKNRRRRGTDHFGKRTLRRTLRQIARRAFCALARQNERQRKIGNHGVVQTERIRLSGFDDGHRSGNRRSGRYDHGDL